MSICKLLGKRQTRSALMGSLQICVFDRGTFWVLPLTYLYLTKSARAYLFPQSVKIHDFCSGPISVDPICPQPTQVNLRTTVSFHNFKSLNFKLSVSNPKSKYVACLSVLSRISNCQGLGRKNKHEILKTDRTPNSHTYSGHLDSIG